MRIVLYVIYLSEVSLTEYAKKPDGSKTKWSLQLRITDTIIIEPSSENQSGLDGKYLKYFDQMFLIELWNWNEGKKRW